MLVRVAAALQPLYSAERVKPLKGAKKGPPITPRRIAFTCLSLVLFQDIGRRKQIKTDIKQMRQRGSLVLFFYITVT